MTTMSMACNLKHTRRSVQLDKDTGDITAHKGREATCTLLKIVSEGISALLDVTVKVARAKRSKALYETQTITQTLSHKIIGP